MHFNTAFCHKSPNPSFQPPPLHPKISFMPSKFIVFLLIITHTYVHVYKVIRSGVGNFSTPAAPSKKSDSPFLRNHEIPLVLQEPSVLGFLTFLIGQRHCGGKHSYVVLRKQYFMASLSIFKFLHSFCSLFSSVPQAMKWRLI